MHRINFNIFAGLILVALSFLLALTTKPYFYWAAFLLHLLGLFCISLYTFRKSNFYNKNALDNSKAYLLIVILFTVTVNFIFIKSYPFGISGDLNRDGGLNVHQLADGILKNPLLYGRYNSHGLIIPALQTPFYWVYGFSDLVFKIPSALIAVLSVVFLFCFLNKLLGCLPAFCSSLLLASAPLHIGFARTEIVVIYSSFFSVLSLWALAFFFEKPIKERAVLLGTLFGFASSFHASMRAFILCIIVFFLLTSFFLLVKRRAKIKALLELWFASIFFYIIGYGPRLIFTNLGIFFKKDQTLSSEIIIENLDRWLIALRKSYTVYFLEPTYRLPHLNFQVPLIDVLSYKPLFVIGLISLIIFRNKIKTKSFTASLLWLIFTVPLTNSAFTNGAASDHRIMPMLVLAAVVVGFGVKFILQISPKKLNLGLSTFLVPLFIFSSSYQAYDLILNERFSVNKNNVNQYLLFNSMPILKKVSLLDTKNRTLCLTGSESLLSFMKPLHIYEAVYYYTAGGRVKLDFSATGLPKNTLYIRQSCENKIDSIKWKEISICSVGKKFSCPRDYKGMGIQLKAMIPEDLSI